MKKLLLIIVFQLFGFNELQAQNIEWMSLAQAMEAQKKEPKKIFMDVYTDWCGPCKLLDKNTLQHNNVLLCNEIHLGFEKCFYLITYKGHTSLCKHP